MMMENGVFLNDGLRNCSENNGQIIIVDSGCPRSLMGKKELAKLKETNDVTEFKVKDEGFRFGPSRVYNTDKKVKVRMQIGIHEIDWEFFIVNSESVPILLGNDVMIPLGGVIDMEQNILVLKNVGVEIPLVHTKGGHLVIPVRSISGANANNIKGEEADAVLIMILENTEVKNIQKFHDTVGHNTFVNIAMTDDEETHVKKTAPILWSPVWKKSVGHIC